MRSLERFSDAARDALREAIVESQGNEVFALGFLDEGGIVTGVEVVARGHSTAVNAVPPWLERGEVLIHNHPSGTLVPSDADLNIAGRAGESGVGSYIVDNDVERVFVVVEPLLSRPKRALDPEELVGALRRDGALGKRMQTYEHRPAQEELLRKVCQCFNEDGILVAEAGTGVGKSFAYLLPAMGWASRNEERVVLSTATINLQQQLFEKDIPLVAEAMKRPPKAILMKGRGNYLCLRRLDDALREASLFQEESESLSAVAAWSSATESGERSDLPFLPDESVWSRVCSEPDLCLGTHCPNRESCFFLRLRKKAAEARIVVVNHHLLFADLEARSSGAGWEGAVVLPPYSRVVLDEAHTIEPAATSFFSGDFTRYSLARLLSRLYRRRRGSPSGIVVRLSALGGDDALLVEVEDAISELQEAAEKTDAAGLALVTNENTFRLRSATGRDSKVSELLCSMAELHRRVGALASAVRALISSLDESAEEDQSLWEAKGLLRRLDSIGSLCGHFPQYEERGDEVFWVERNRTSKGDTYPRFVATPLDVAAKLREALFDPCASVTCVSATLAVEGKFDFWLNRVGLSLRDIQGTIARPLLSGNYPSPFPYARATLLSAPTDAPLPEESGYSVFVDEAVRSLLRRSEGGALVLFTSYDALRSAYAGSLPLARELGLRILKQGDDDRSRLLRTFIDDRNSVLFATDSFWEGVDAPGDTLRMVIIARLPFRTPNDPVFEARRESVERRGGNPFMELSLPEAVTRFKQGFGRLMRKNTDRGVVVVLDGRLLRKRYGSLFVRSLPETRQSFKPFGELLDDVARFLSE